MQQGIFVLKDCHSLGFFEGMQQGIFVLTYKILPPHPFKVILRMTISAGAGATSGHLLP
jgi:hypothetical protein